MAIAKLDVIHHGTANLRGQFRHDALRRLGPVRLQRREYGISPKQIRVGSRTRPGIVGVPESDAVDLGYVVVGANIPLTPIRRLILRAAPTIGAARRIKRRIGVSGIFAPTTT